MRADSLHSKRMCKTLQHHRSTAEVEDNKSETSVMRIVILKVNDSRTDLHRVGNCCFSVCVGLYS